MTLQQALEKRDCRELARLCSPYKELKGIVWIGYFDKDVYEIKVERDNYFNFNSGEKGGYKQLAQLLGFNEAFDIRDCKNIYKMIQTSEDLIARDNKLTIEKLSSALDQYFSVSKTA